MISLLLENLEEKSHLCPIKDWFSKPCQWQTLNAHNNILFRSFMQLADVNN